MNINVVVMTHNEETAFRALQKVSECTSSRGQVLVLDDHSEASFAAYIELLCKEYGFRFEQRHMNFDYGAQRQAALAMLPGGEWVFRLDADEAIEPDFLNACAACIEANPEADCLRAMVRHVILGNDYIQRPIQSRSWRLFQTSIELDTSFRVLLNLPHIRYVSTIHEQPTGMRHIVDLPPQFEIVETKTAASQLVRHIWCEYHFHRHTR